MYAIRSYYGCAPAEDFEVSLYDGPNEVYTDVVPVVPPGGTAMSQFVAVFSGRNNFV